MSDSTKAGLTHLHGVVEDLRRNQEGDIAIVLIGSAARGLWNEASDVDLLFLGKTRPEVAKNVSGYHIQAASEAEFLRNLSLGEDFEAWCVRFGTTLYDSGIWATIKESNVAATWPRWQVKVVHGARRLFLAGILLETGDRHAAAEETVYVLGHIARGILMRGGVFPLSRPELAEQVRNVGYPHLADIHERLRNSEDIPIHVLRLAQRYSKKLLCSLDSEIYRSSAEDYRRNKRAKQSRRGSS
jgi:hypothetical protein